jgi:hypothetical protein
MIIRLWKAVHTSILVVPYYMVGSLLYKKFKRSKTDSMQSHI